jgi:hypothetical protein
VHGFEIVFLCTGGRIRVCLCVCDEALLVSTENTIPLDGFVYCCLVARVSLFLNCALLCFLLSIELSLSFFYFYVCVCVCVREIIEIIIMENI